MRYRLADEDLEAGPVVTACPVDGSAALLARKVRIIVGAEGLEPPTFAL
jgi:hypothetical protein